MVKFFNLSNYPSKIRKEGILYTYEMVSSNDDKGGKLDHNNNL